MYIDVLRVRIVPDGPFGTRAHAEPIRLAPSDDLRGGQKRGGGGVGMDR